MITEEPIIKFKTSIFSWKRTIEKNTPKGIFKLFITANVEYFTAFAPLFHNQKPIPVGTIARYKIDKIWGFVRVKVEKSTEKNAHGKISSSAPKYALDIIFTASFPIYFFHKTCPKAKQQFEVSIKTTPLTIILNARLCQTIIPAPKTDIKIHKIYTGLNFSPKKQDQRATKTGVVVVKSATSFPCKYLKAFKNAKYIIPNWKTPITIAIMCVFRLNFFKNGKNINVATNNLHKTTNSEGKTLNWLLISPKDNEKHIVAIIKYDIFTSNQCKTKDYNNKNIQNCKIIIVQLYTNLYLM